MNILIEFPVTDEILTSYALAIGADLPGYRNHIYRVLNFYRAICGIEGLPTEAVQIAGAFHDLGIWTDQTIDYLEPSVRQATDYLDRQHLSHLSSEVSALILEHHKIRAYAAEHALSVEPFRRADVIDVSLGLLTFGLPRAWIKTVKATFPNHGFHGMLLRQTARQFLRSPLKPLPMFRW
ncbi:HD domain-containing protein [Pseudomonas sp. DR48]|uniref:HD domain-containing protein n=1 Tax=Pseudomonas sp. DR48 TaxID=2871095 RepID=UPI001C99C37B|nr:HD domain-containing protein [Pseudomonas sp. DR48]QZP30811.1 HD domain-containing protein [Pseudomonas sp. DR48]